MKDNLERLLFKLLPEVLSNFLGILYGVFKGYRKSYSQFGEDLILTQYLIDKCGVNKGFYIDIGAYHPRFISNTHLLYKRGWCGVCVDLDEEKLKWFRLFRGNSVETICAAVAPTDSKGEITFYKHKRLLSEIDTIDENVAIENKLKRGWDFSSKSVPSVTINELLNKYEGKSIDFLNIDIEGVDELVLLNLDFEKFRPRVILFEDNKNFGGSSRVVEKLKEEGYSKLFISGGSIAYFTEIEKSMFN